MLDLQIPKGEDVSCSPSLPSNSNKKGEEVVRDADGSDPSTRVCFSAAKSLRAPPPSGESYSLSIETSGTKTLIPTKNSLQECGLLHASDDLPPLLTSPLSRHQAFFKTSDPATQSAVIAHDTQCVEPVVRTKFDAAARRYLQSEALVLYQEHKHIKAQKELLACEETERREKEVDGLCLLEALAGWQREIKENLFGNKTASRALARLLEKLQDRMDFQSSIEHDEEERLKNEGRIAWENIVEKQRQIALEEKENARLQREKMNMERRAIVFLIADEKRQRASLEMSVIQENDAFFDALVPARAADEEQITLELRRRSEEHAAKMAKQQKEAKRLRIELARDERLFGVTQKLMIDACRHGPRKTSVFTGAHRKTECLTCRVRYDEEWQCYVSIDHPEPPPAIRLMMNKQKAATSPSGNGSSPISSASPMASPGVARQAVTFTNDGGSPKNGRHTAALRRRSASSALPIRAVGVKGIGLGEEVVQQASTPASTALGAKGVGTLESPFDVQVMESPKKGRRLPAHSVDKRKKNACQEVDSRVDGSETQGGRRNVRRSIGGTRRGKEGPPNARVPSFTRVNAVRASTGMESSKSEGSSYASEIKGLATNAFLSTVKKSPTETPHEVAHHTLPPGRVSPSGKTVEEYAAAALLDSNPEQDTECQQEEGMVIPIPPSSSPAFAPKTSEERIQHLHVLLSKTKSQDLAVDETFSSLSVSLQDESGRKDVTSMPSMWSMMPSGGLHARVGGETEPHGTAERKGRADDHHEECASSSKKMHPTQGKLPPLSSPTVGTSASSPIPRRTIQKATKEDTLHTGADASPHAVMGDQSAVRAAKQDLSSLSRRPLIQMESKADGDASPSGARTVADASFHAPTTVKGTGDACTRVHDREKDRKEKGKVGRTSALTSASEIVELLSGGVLPATTTRGPPAHERSGGRGGATPIASLLARRSLPSLVPPSRSVGVRPHSLGVPVGERMVHASSSSEDGGTTGASPTIPRISIEVEGKVESALEGGVPSLSYPFPHPPQKKPFLSKNFKSASCTRTKGKDKTLEDKNMEKAGGVRRGVAFIEPSETTPPDAAGEEGTKNYSAAAEIRVGSAVAFSSPIPTASGKGA